MVTNFAGSFLPGFFPFEVLQNINKKSGMYNKILFVQSEILDLIAYLNTLCLIAPRALFHFKSKQYLLMKNLKNKVVIIYTIMLHELQLCQLWDSETSLEKII